LWIYGKQEIERIQQQTQLFVSPQDTAIEQVFSNLSNASIKTVGPELVFGSIYDNIGILLVDILMTNKYLFFRIIIKFLFFKISKLMNNCKNIPFQV